MSEPSIEEIVARMESGIAAGNRWVMTGAKNARALIASWRERGEALVGLRERIARGYLGRRRRN